MPLGYRNVDGTNGKRVIEPDPEAAPHVTRILEQYATGGLALRDVAKKARADGFSYPVSIRALSFEDSYKAADPTYSREAVDTFATELRREMTDLI